MLQTVNATQSIPAKGLDQYIVATSGICGGRPRLAGHRITVYDVVVWRNQLGMAFEEIAVEYDLSLASVYAAMTFYYDHKDEIDQRAEADRAIAEKFRRQNPSRLEDKLRQQHTINAPMVEMA